MGRGPRATCGAVGRWGVVLLGLVSACSAVKSPAADTAAAGTSSKLAADSAGVPGRREVLFIGTSLTAGLGLPEDSAYPSLVQLKIDSAGLPYRVTNAGVSGETSAGLLERIDWLMRGHYDVVVVETGANDGLRALPVSSLRRNVDAVLTRIDSAQPGAQVVLVQMEAPPNLGATYTRAFHAVFPEAAKRHGALLMPFLLAGVAGDPGLNQPDGMHPNLSGERIVASNVWRVLKPILAGRARAAVKGAAR